MELYKKTAHEISSMIKNKEISCTEVTKSVLNRVNEVEPKLNSYITICEEEALKKASALDEKVSKGEAKGDLFGVPMALKDNICTEGVLTTCSSKMLENYVSPYSATVAEKLNDANTILIGKTNLDEFAMGASTETSYMGATKNPWDITRVPGGSSGGSAAAIVSGEAFFALGSDTGGSIRQPAAFSGCVGLKPTYGHVSRYGVVAFASSLDQVGPLTKDVTDSALVLNAISGYDLKDATSANINYPDYKNSLVNDVKGLKIGVPKQFFGEGINSEVKQSVHNAIEKYREMGATIQEFDINMIEYALPTYYIIACSEASSNLARFDGIKFGHRAEKFEDLADLYKQSRSEGFGEEVKRRIMLGTYALSSGYYDAYYKKALQVRTLIKKEFDRVFKNYDLLLTPTTTTTAFKIGEKSDNPLEMYLSDLCTVSINIAGIPAISLPCGFDTNNLPIGMQLIGKAFDESTLIRAAYTFEQNTEFHKKKPIL